VDTIERSGLSKDGDEEIFTEGGQRLKFAPSVSLRNIEMVTMTSAPPLQKERTQRILSSPGENLMTVITEVQADDTGIEDQDQMVAVIVDVDDNGDNEIDTVVENAAHAEAKYLLRSAFTTGSAAKSSTVAAAAATAASSDNTPLSDDSHLEEVKELQRADSDPADSHELLREAFSRPPPTPGSDSDHDAVPPTLPPSSSTSPYAHHGHGHHSSGDTSDY
jgi:hypothetical protein